MSGLYVLQVLINSLVCSSPLTTSTAGFLCLRPPCQRHYVFGLSVRERFCASGRALVLLARCLTNQRTDFHQTLADDVHCVSKKTLFVLAHIFHMCQLIFTIFGRRMPQEICNKKCIISLLCTVCVTPLPCKILITTLVTRTAVLVHSKCKIVIFELLHASK